METLFANVTVIKKHSPSNTNTNTSSSSSNESAARADGASIAERDAGSEPGGNGGKDDQRIQKPAAKLLSNQGKLRHRQLLARSARNGVEDKFQAALAAQIPDATPGADAKEWAKKQPKKITTVAKGAAADAAASSGGAQAGKAALPGISRKGGGTASGMHSHVRRNAHKGNAPGGRHHHQHKARSKSSSSAASSGVVSSNVTSSGGFKVAPVKIIISPKGSPMADKSSNATASASKSTTTLTATPTHSSSSGGNVGDEGNSDAVKDQSRAPARFYRMGGVVVLEPRNECGWEFRVSRNNALLQPDGRDPGPSGSALAVGAKWALLVLLGGLAVAGGCFVAAQREAERQDQVSHAQQFLEFDRN
jgi:hypothetical protein